MSENVTDFKKHKFYIVDHTHFIRLVLIDKYNHTDAAIEYFNTLSSDLKKRDHVFGVCDEVAFLTRESGKTLIPNNYYILNEHLHEKDWNDISTYTWKKIA